MRIAQVAPLSEAVPPILYGGTERVVSWLTEGLVDRGHDVTLFAHPDSRPPCALVGWTGGSSISRDDTVRNAAQLAVWIRRQPERHRAVCGRGC